MADQLQLRGGTTTEHETFTGVTREVTVDTTKKTAVVHDGITPGGMPLTTSAEFEVLEEEVSTQVADYLQTKGTVEASTALATPNTLVKRGSTGTASFGSPADDTHPLRLGDAWTANIKHDDTVSQLGATETKTAVEVLAARTVTNADDIDAVESRADSIELDLTNATELDSANTLARRDPNGNIEFAAPYADKHPLRLGDATVEATANKVAIRDSAGRIAVGAPVELDHAVRLLDLQAAGASIDTRQAIQKAPVNTVTGNPQYLTTGTGLQVITNAITALNPLVVAFGNGFGPNGAVDKLLTIEADIAFGSLSPNTTNYLHLIWDAGLEQLFTDYDVVAPIYSINPPGAPAVGQFWYPSDHRSSGAYWDGLDWIPQLRVYLGQAATDDTVVTSTVHYAVNQGVAGIANYQVPSITGRGQVFTASGTFTVPAGVTAVKVTVVGGGGNGGAATASYAIGRGGGGGGCAIKYVTDLIPGSSIPVTVGGVAGTSSFGSHCSATGGATGAANLITSGGVTAAGVGVGGDLNISGGQGIGGRYLDNVSYMGGGGGAAFSSYNPLVGGATAYLFHIISFSDTGQCRNTPMQLNGIISVPGTGRANVSGTSAGGYGAGGAGAGKVTAAVSPGAGRPGIVLVEW